MTPFAADIVKIVVDRGLLALVLLGLGYCLNRALERHRARFTYAQKFSEARIQAYREISEALANQTVALNRFLQLIASENQDAEAVETTAREMLEVHAAYVAAYPSIAVSLLKNSVFFSSDLAERMIKHQGGMAELRGIIGRRYGAAEEYENAREKIRLVVLQVNEAGAMAAHQISQEMAHNPFA